MSRTLATMIALMLGLPVLAFVAAGAAVGINPNIYLGAIGFIAGVCFIGAAVLEVRRLAATRSEDLVHGWIPKQVLAPARLVPTPASDEHKHTRVEVIRGPKADESDALRARRAA